MKLIKVEIKAPKAYLVPLGDLHLGSAFCDFKKFEGYVEWIRKNRNAYVILMGDLFDIPTRESKTSPFEQAMDTDEAMKLLKETIRPIKRRILCAITGNHENRLKTYAGLSPTALFCDIVDIPFCGYSAVVLFKVNKAKYVFYAHHTTGGGATIGGKINRVQKLTNIVTDADCYLGGHNHSKAFGEDAIYYIDPTTEELRSRRIIYVDCGSFHLYEDSYAEAAMLPPSHTGAPRIRMDGLKKDLHVSF